MAKIRVLIADDHPTLREGLVVVLQSTGEIEVIGQAGSGQEAIYLAKQLQPDVVVMDVQMAEQLHITERTVKNHIANIMAKLGVESRTEVILLVLKERLIELD